MSASDPSFQAGDFDGQSLDTGEVPIEQPVPVQVRYVYKPTGTYELSNNKLGRPRFSYARLRAKLGLS